MPGWTKWYMSFAHRSSCARVSSPWIMAIRKRPPVRCCALNSTHSARNSLGVIRPSAPLPPLVSPGSPGLQGALPLRYAHYQDVTLRRRNRRATARSGHLRIALVPEHAAVRSEPDGSVWFLGHARCSTTRGVSREEYNRVLGRDGTCFRRLGARPDDDQHVTHHLDQHHDEHAAPKERAQVRDRGGPVRDQRHPD